MTSANHRGAGSIAASNPDKVLFPKSSVTKADVVRYYGKIAAQLLYHIDGRALTIQRFPDGIHAQGFFQQQRADYFDEAVAGRVLARKDGGELEHIVCDAPACPVRLADLGAITFHMWLSRIDKPDLPDRLLFDLDPPGQDFSVVQKGGRLLKEFLDQLGLRSFVMTTGSTGAHVVVPLRRQADFDEVRRFALDAGRWLGREHPKLLTTAQRKDKRGDRLYIDALRNGYGQTGVAPYTLRSRVGAPVATPLEWREFFALSGGSTAYTIANILQRLGQKKDPWHGLKRYARSLAKPREKLDRMLA